MAWDKEQAQAATELAEVELNKLIENMSPDQVAAVDVVRQWWRKWYNGASGRHPTGHKALARIIVK